MEKISRLTPKFEFSSAPTPTNSPALLTANTQLVSNSKANGGRGAASTLVVLFRLEHPSVDKMRTFYSDCELDAGGLMLRADAPARMPIAEGEVIRVRVAPEWVVIVPDDASEETGRLAL